MADQRLTPEDRQRRACAALARLPGRLPWRLVDWAGQLPRAQRMATRSLLEQRFRQVFPHAGAALHAQWARAHLDMLACETLDAMALWRLGQPNGPELMLNGWEHVECLQREGRGYILVLNHFDRLLAAPIALARRGARLSHVTMPVRDNRGISESMRTFLMHKIGSFTDILGGAWRTAEDSFRPVHESLRAGGAWVILADAWSPTFRRLREHPFLGGMLSLPTGIERLAQATGAALLHGTTCSQSNTRLQVQVERLPDDPRRAMDAVVARLEHDVRQRPWAWWQWGAWDEMWHAAPATQALRGEGLG